MDAQIFTKREGSRVAYVLVGRHFCDACGERLVYRGFCFATWSDSRNVDFSLLCHNCLGQRPPILPRQRQHYFGVLITEHVPRGAVPYFFKPPVYAPGALSSFDAALPNAKTVADSTGARVVDRTRIAGRPDATISPDALVGAPDHKLLYEMDRPVSIREVETLLDFHANAPTALSEEERRLLEGER